MNIPADFDEWDESVCFSYPVKKYLIENSSVKIKLFSVKTGPTFMTNAPYLEEGGIVGEISGSEQFIVDEISELKNRYKLNYVLIKSRDSLLCDYLPEQQIDSDYYSFILDISTGTDAIWNNKLKAKNRNQIRKAQKYNFQIEFGHIDLLSYFYSVLSQCWRDLGTPMHSYIFFKTLLEKFDDKIRIVVLFDNKRPISAALLFNLNGVLSHPFAGTLNQYKPSSANNLLYWSIINYACDNYINTFDMGRCRLGQGTYNFKKSWGGDATRLYYYYFLDDKQTLPSYETPYYKVATSLWKYIPIPLANRLGPKLIYRIL